MEMEALPGFCFAAAPLPEGPRESIYLWGTFQMVSA